MNSSRHRRLSLAWIGATGVATILAVSAVGVASAGSARSDQHLPPAKAARLQTELDRLATMPKASKAEVAARLKAQAPGDAAAGRAADAAGLSPGIVATQQGPFAATEFTVRNMYRAPVQGVWLFVFAGGARDEAGTITQGGLRIYQRSASGEYGPVGTFASPAGGGALVVRSASGSVLTLATDSGQIVLFDLGTLKYLS